MEFVYPADVHAAAKADYERSMRGVPSAPAWEDLKNDDLGRSAKGRSYTRVTSGLIEHPEGYEGPCVCKMCRSYI